MNQPLLKITDLHVATDGKEILKGLNLEIRAGEMHAIMGPNGSGKSTLAYTLAGRDGYELTRGRIEFDGRDLGEMSIEERAAAGLFLAMQYPVEIPGVNNAYFLRAALNAQRASRGEPEIDSVSFLRLVRAELAQLDMDESLLKRSVNAGFSGGEKKRNEILQMAVLKPRLAVLDETDSGLDIDALKRVAEGVNRLRDEQRAFLVITHYQRLLDYLSPDHVHVLSDGRIVESGDRSLAERLEREGYAFLDSGAA
ncbi:MAG: Fe-S cluster assembly ATPase SufC [Wenzhouxiangellaceae bacterium]